MTVDQEQRAGFDTPAGPALAAFLAGVDLAALEGADAVAAARAWFRLGNQVTAGLLAALHHAARARAGTTERLPRLDEFSGDEAAAALGWSRTMAARRLDLADDLALRLPEVAAAMGGGDLEEVKARVFSDWTRDLADDHAHHVCAHLLPDAPRLSVAALIARLQKLAIALDPDWAARRQKAAEAHARVVATVTPAGTADVCGRDLPVPGAVAVMARVEALAAAVRRRVRRPIATLRALVYLRLLDGSVAGLDDAAVVDQLVVELDRPEDGDGGPGPGGGPGPDGGPDSGPDSGPSADDPSGSDDGDGGGAWLGAPPLEDDGRDEPDPDDPDEPEPDEPEPDEPEPDEPEPDDSDPAVHETPPTGGDESARRVRQGVVEVRLRLSTALGLDDLPGEVPGWGTVLARSARTLIDRHHRAEWRLVLTDDHGRLRHVLLLRHRPRPDPLGPRRPRRGALATRAVVELAVPATLLGALAPDRHPGWAAVLREAHRRLAHLPDPDGPDSTDSPASGDEHPATTRRDAARRRPGRELDRWIRVRDRSCIGPTCTRPTHSADLDHTRAWQHGGATVATNLGAPCRHCHRLKHQGRWTLRQPAPGHFRWTSRAGVRHDTAPRPVTDPLPGPAPRADGRPRPVPDEHWTHRRREDPTGAAAWDRAPADRPTPPAAPAARTPTVPAHADDPPPF